MFSFQCKFLLISVRTFQHDSVQIDWVVLLVWSLIARTAIPKGQQSSQPASLALSKEDTDSGVCLRVKVDAWRSKGWTMQLNSKTLCLRSEIWVCPKKMNFLCCGHWLESCTWEMFCSRPPSKMKHSLLSLSFLQ